MRFQRPATNGSPKSRGCSRRAGCAAVGRPRRFLPALERLDDRLVPSSGSPTIAGLAYGGTGSPQGSAVVAIADDHESATLIFDHFVASQGPGIPITEARKNSQINLELEFERGTTNFTLTVDYRGYS